MTGVNATTIVALNEFVRLVDSLILWDIFEGRTLAHLMPLSLQPGLRLDHFDLLLLLIQHIGQPFIKGFIGLWNVNSTSTRVCVKLLLLLLLS